MAIYTTRNNGTPPEIRYLHRDHLGSMAVITNATGHALSACPTMAGGYILAFLLGRMGSLLLLVNPHLSKRCQTWPRRR